MKNEEQNIEKQKGNGVLPCVSIRLFIGCDVKLKSNEHSTGVIVGKSQRGKYYWKVEWNDGSGITNILGSTLNVC